jgi:hypothetical protein
MESHESRSKEEEIVKKRGGKEGKEKGGGEGVAILGGRVGVGGFKGGAHPRLQAVSYSRTS